MKIYRILFFAILLIANAVFAQKKPNVILILTDDQGWGDLSLHGNPWLETPNLDKLASRGSRFTHCYVSPLCAPTRASILTGRYHLKTNVVSVSKGLEIMNTDETTLAELFKANGYKTGIFGKWHNGEHYPNRPNDQGFDEFLGFTAGHLSNYFNTWLSHNAGSIKTKGYITDVLTDAALDFIKSNQQNPFFCFIPYNAPHTPHQVPDKYFNKYKAKGLDNELASIYGMVENVDDNVGRLVNFLNTNQLGDNTIIIFMSDNGPNGIRYNGGMKGIKGTVHEGGVRVPFFISWKDHIPADKKLETPIAHIDIYPTLSALCSLKPVPGKPVDGVSFASLIFNTKNNEVNERNLFTHVNFMELPVTANAGGFRNDQYRFVFEKNTSKVFDLLKDPGELNDISGQNEMLTRQYLTDYRQWFQDNIKNIATDRPVQLSEIGAELPVYEASLSSGIKFKEGHGWAHDWIEKWNTTTDSLYWEIDCIKPGKYKIELEYLCKKEDVGSQVMCSLGDEEKIFTIHPYFYSQPITSPDRVTRKEAYEMKEWKKLHIGFFIVKPGRQVLKLKALKVKNENVAEVKGVSLTFENK